ncbi:MAG: hypothetical protein AAFY46_15835, partial [Planctomycetota bacterium]
GTRSTSDQWRFESMTTVTRSLFGGVLLSAGLVADAESQKLVLSGRQSLFNNASTAVEVFGYDYCSTPPKSDRVTVVMLSNLH